MSNKQGPMLFYDLFNKQSRIDGRGAFALAPIPARRKIGNLGGELISLKEARRRAMGRKRIAMVEFGNGKALDASEKSNALKYVNHSCSPNTFMRIAHNRVEFWSLRRISKGEELTCNYGPTHHDGKLPCQCGSVQCKGFI